MTESGVAGATDAGAEAERAAAAVPSAPDNRRRKRLLVGLAAVFVLLGLGYLGYWWFVARFSESTDDAYVAGDIVNVTAQIAGTVTGIAADETDRVERGDTLVQLDDTDARLALEQASANLAETVRRVRGLYASRDQMRANVKLREAELAKARSDLARRRALIDAQAVSQEELHHAESAYAAARAALAAAREELAAAAVLAGDTDREHHPLVAQARARLHEAEVALARTRVPAPVSGYVAQRSVQLGERVSPGTPLLSIVPLDRVWAEANFKENQLAGLRIGQPVQITADQYGGSVVYHGRVEGIGAGTGSAFALLPPQNASGNWIKIVQRLPVRIRLDPTELAAHPLRVGLSLKVVVDIHDQHGPVLARMPVEGMRLQTPVYRAQAIEAEARTE